MLFADTTWFRKNLSGIGQYTLTHEWFVDTFGDVYLDWAEGYYFDADGWVQQYMNQIRRPAPNEPFVSLTPDAKVEIIDERPAEPTAGKI